MADYWKSQPRKFCDYCKCWIADNKPSIDFHERGKNHKENVAAKISEIKKKSQQKAKQEERMSKEFAKMEEAAMKAYQEDLKRMEREAAGLPSLEPTTTAQSQPQVRPTVQPQPQLNKVKQQKPQQKKGKTKQKPREHRPVQVWVEGQTEEGHIYYYNTLTGESQWENPGGSQGASSASVPPLSSSDCPWAEAVSPEGYTYYYNSETGESSWEKPAGFPSSEQRESNKEVESQEESPAPQTEALSAPGDHSSVEAQVPEDPKEQSSIPKITFRKRKAETEPSEKEGDAKIGEDAPEDDVKEVKKEEEVQTSPAEPEQKQEDVTQSEIRSKRPKAANPYGSWERVKVEKDPYASVDLQLPQVEESTSTAPTELPAEPKQKFKERVITSLGDQSGPASFRKSKTQNGKSRSLRQRDDD